MAVLWNFVWSMRQALAVLLWGPNGPQRRWGKAKHPHNALEEWMGNNLYISIQKHPVYADKLT